MGAKTGLYAAPLRGDGHAGVAEPSGAPVYRVRGGLIEIKGRQYPIRLPDGLYAIRKLTVTECCRLQTLPDDYCRAVSATQGYRGLGNGWTAEAIIHLLRHALSGAPKNEKIEVLSMYDGIGTGRYCLDMLGFADVEYQAYETDKYAIQIAQNNYPDILQRGDAFGVRDAGWAF
jgi:DNA (cytosine-5)-methyltransferase 3A